MRDLAVADVDGIGDSDAYNCPPPLSLHFN